MQNIILSHEERLMYLHFDTLSTNLSTAKISVNVAELSKQRSIDCMRDNKRLVDR